MSVKSISRSRQPSSGPRRPVAHLLALAPMDVWVRMLLASSGVGFAYWLRLLGVLATSVIGTMCAMPERVGVWLWCTLMGLDDRYEHQAGVLVVLGSYRSGTTHTHNLLSCDPRVVTPRWGQALLPHGFVLSWLATRVLLAPFLGSTRPQDSVGFGASWPAEEDFALSGWGVCSPLPGRFVFPSDRSCWSRFHTLESCTDLERRRFRRTLARFVWKVTRGSKDKILVLKTPTHGAHLRELEAALGTKLKYIWVQRDPERVLDSNMRMHHTLRHHALQRIDHPDSLRAQILDELLETEQRCAAHLGSIDPSRWCAVAHEDLAANPVGILSSALEQIGQRMSGPHRAAARRYLANIGPHKAQRDAQAPLGAPRKDESAHLDAIRAVHQSANDQRATCETPDDPLPERDSVHQSRGVWFGLMTAIGFGLAWIGLIWVIKQIDPDLRPRLDQLVWVCGAVSGMVAMRAAGGGSSAAGLTTAIATGVVFLVISFPITVINWHWAQGESTQAFLYHNGKGALHGASSLSSLVFLSFGCLAAWRHAGPGALRAPGS